MTTWPELVFRVHNESPTHGCGLVGFNTHPPTLFQLNIFILLKHIYFVYIPHMSIDRVKGITRAQPTVMSMVGILLSHRVTT